MCKITINGVSITLTQDQINEIAKKSNVKQKLTIKDIDYKTAKKLLSDHDIKPDPKGLYNGKLLELMTIIKAVNFIDNNYEEWKPDFTDSTYKYIPYFIKKSSGWLVYYVLSFCSISIYSLGFYFKNEESAKFISNKYLDLYNQIL